MIAIQKSSSGTDYQAVDTVLAALAAVLFAAIFFLYAYHRELGWFILVALYGVIAAEVDIRRNPRLFAAIAAIAFVHEMTAVFNLYGHTLPGAETDAQAFLVYASNRVTRDIEAAISLDLYRNFLIILLDIQGGSWSMASFSSVVAFTLTILFFNRLLTLAGIERTRIPLLMVFGLMPHVLVYTSITLREPLQLLFFVATVYYGVSFRTSGGISNCAMFFLCAACLAILHQVLVPFTLLLVAIILLWPMGRTSAAKTLLRVTATLVIVGSLGAATLHIMSTQRFTGVGIILKMAEFDADYFLRQIKGYRLAIDKDKPRSTLDVDVDTESFATLALSMPRLYLSYWFAPLPWNAENARDMVATALSMMRVLLVVVVIAGFCTARGDKKLQSLFTLLFLLMCSTWVLGTTNYGQAIRHQVLSDWLLLLVAGGFVERRLIAGSGTDQQP